MTRARGRRRAGRRHPLRRADAAGVRPRRLQLDPRVRPDLAVLRRAGRSARAATASAGSARRRRWATRSTTGRRSSCAATSRRPRPGLGPDRDAYRRLFGWLVDDADTLLPDLLAPFHVPLSPIRALRMARFGLLGLQPATRVARRFRGDAARALFAGIAAHSILPLTEPVSAAAALLLGAAAHVDGWPFPEGGAGRLPEAMAAELRGAGRPDRDRAPRRAAGATCPSTASRCSTPPPAALATIAGDRLPAGYRRRLERYRHGPGVFKLDIAIDGPIPWRAPELLERGDRPSRRDARGDRALRVGGRRRADPGPAVRAADADEPVRPEPGAGRPAHGLGVLPRPQRIVGGRRAIGSCARSSGSRRASGTGSSRRRRLGPAAIEAYNANYVGGDIAGGRFDLGQLFTRPSLRILDPYATPDRVALPLLGVDAAGRRRPRDVRRPCCAVGAPPPRLKRRPPVLRSARAGPPVRAAPRGEPWRRLAWS